MSASRIFPLRSGFIAPLGFQVETDEELRDMRAQLEAADALMIEEAEQPCCYAKSDK
jgi:hypothetical protein